MSGPLPDEQLVAVGEAEEKAKKRHLELSDYIKSVHAGLRRKFKQSGGDSDTVWYEHCSDTDTLARYAAAMHQLATDVWSRRDDTRIDWCRRACLDYFMGGGLQRLREKDERRRQHDANSDGVGDEMTGNSDCDNDPDAHEDDCGNHMDCAAYSASKDDFPEVRLTEPEAMDTGCGVVGGPVVPSGGVRAYGEAAAVLAAVLPRPLVRLGVGDADKQRRFADGENSDSCCQLDYCSSDVIAASLLTTRGSTSSLNVSESEARTLDLSRADGAADDDKGGDVSRVSHDDDTVDAETQDQLGDLDEEIIHDDHAPVKYNVITLPFREKIRLLDVGSCYDPFSEFKDFHSVGIDISPAVPSVLRCDFLQLQTTAPLQLASDSLSTYVSALRSPLTSLSRCLFHSVVFSLFLGYLPSPSQRWLACCRAAEMLVPDGLLLVVTPDSHAQHRNAATVRGWRTALQAVGFTRVRYEKQQHIHCMAFRLVALPATRPLAADWAPLMSIPQDFSDDSQQEEGEEKGGEGECAESLLDGFNELPGGVGGSK